jgi:magnesium transporter
MTQRLNPDLKTLHQQVKLLLDSAYLNTLRELLKKQHPADIADLLEIVSEEQQIIIFELLQDEMAAEVLDETGTEVTRDLVDAIPDEKIADLLEAMPNDDAAEVLSELDDDRAEDILALMQPKDAAEVEALLAYPEGTAGRLMATEVVKLRTSWTVERSIEHLRTVDTEAETLAYLYVVDSHDHLTGVIPLHDLITSPASRKLSDLTPRSVISVRVDTDQEEVARIVSQYDFFAVPVISMDGKLVGIITHDDVVDILQDEFTEDVQRMGGSEPLEDSYLSASIFEIVRKRVGWLLVLFLVEMLTGSLLRYFQTEIQTVMALLVFVPLLIGTGGNAGSQATSTIIRAIAVGEARFEDLWKLLWHEARVGFMLGLVMALAGLIPALMWNSPVPLALTVAAALFTTVFWANIIGALLPPLMAKLRIDPAALSGPVMSTLVDASGLFIYFTLAGWIIR